MAAAEYLSDPKAGIARTVRASQVRMAQAVEEVFTSENPQILFVEAGTGTGKSFAYGVNALLSEHRVIISTAKKSLQGQLIFKDLPFLAEKLKPGAAYAQLKGRANYACMLRFKEHSQTDQYKSLPIYEREKIEQWMVDDPFNDLADLPLTFAQENYVRVSECVRKSCPHSENACGFIAAREKALAARVLVVNHALLAYDLSLGGGKILGPYGALIIDEAHQAPSFFREAFSLRLHHKQPESLRRLFDGTEFEPSPIFESIYETIFSQLPAQNAPLVVTDQLRQCFADLDGELWRIQERLSTHGLLSDDEDDAPVDGDFVAGVRAKLKTGAGMIVKARKLSKIVLGNHIVRDEDGEVISEGPEYLIYVDKRGRGDVPELVVTPIEVGPLVAPSLLSVKRVVVTSATLATTTGMEYMSREFGLSTRQITSLVLPSPFEYRKLCTAYIPGNMPDPSGRNDMYYEAMCDEMHDLLTASKGGGLILCTSYDDMERFADGCRRRVRELQRGVPVPYHIATQSGTPDTLLDWFKRTPKAALFAVKTFWEGIDIPGLGLRLVIIPKLPFPMFGDVVLQARKGSEIDRMKELGFDQKRAEIAAWGDFDFQEMIRDLKQGVGRLIRAETDMGVVALLDNRAFGNVKAYSSKVRAALPMGVTVDKNAVKQLLSSLAGHVVPPETAEPTPLTAPKMDRSDEL